MVTVGMPHQLQFVEIILTILSKQLIKQQHLRMISCQSVMVIKFQHITVMTTVSSKAYPQPCATGRMYTIAKWGVSTVTSSSNIGRPTDASRCQYSLLLILPIPK